MKKKLIKIIVLFLVFIGAVTFFEYQTSQVNEALTSKMEEATLPVLHFSIDEYEIGELHGYTGDMEEASLRDSIVSSGDSDSLAFVVDCGSTTVTGISYQIRSIDGSRLLAEDTVTGYNDMGSSLSGQIKLPNILSYDTEYLLNIDLKMEDKTADYYCRLVRTKRCHELECLDFALSFHKNTFLEEEGEEFIRPYMDRASDRSTSLQFVTLGSSLAQVMWGDFNGNVVGDPTVSFQEINGSYVELTLAYVMTSINEGGENEYFNVKEYYRLRYTEDRMYVLNFERTVGQIFRQENTFLTSSNNILLGIRDKDVESAVSPKKDAVFFVQEGELWGYDLSTNILTDIFSFRGAEGIDDRSNYNAHDIRILRVDESKNVDFAVYGYMNRGAHEGEVCLIIYRFNEAVHTIEELACIPYEVSYDIMKEEAEIMLYENAMEEVYLLYGNDLLCLDLNSGESRMVAEDLVQDSYRISYDKRYIAWVPGDQHYSSSQICLMDLEEDRTFTIEGDGHDYVVPVAFMEHDFIYGAADKKDIYLDDQGNTVFPMSALLITQIEETELKLIKNYTPSGSRIGSVTVDSFTLHLELVKVSGGHSEQVGTDAIVNREATEETAVKINTFTDGAKQRVVQLMTETTPGKAKLRVLSADVIKNNDHTRVELPKADRSGYYYIYAKGGLSAAYDDAVAAIKEANAQVGSAAYVDGRLLWKRAKKNYVNAFSDLSPAQEDSQGGSLCKCLSTMTLYGGIYKVVGNYLEQGGSPAEFLEEAFPDKDILTLTGLDVERVLYYISSGSPVLAMTGKDQALLLVGYTATDIYYYDPADDAVHNDTYDTINSLCKEGGQQYVIYIH